MYRKIYSHANSIRVMMMMMMMMMEREACVCDHGFERSDLCAEIIIIIIYIMVLSVLLVSILNPSHMYLRLLLLFSTRYLVHINRSGLNHTQ